MGLRASYVENHWYRLLPTFGNCRNIFTVWHGPDSYEWTQLWINFQQNKINHLLWHLNEIDAVMQWKIVELKTFSNEIKNGDYYSFFSFMRNLLFTCNVSSFIMYFFCSYHLNVFISNSLFSRAVRIEHEVVKISFYEPVRVLKWNKR